MPASASSRSALAGPTPCSGTAAVGSDSVVVAPAVAPPATRHTWSFESSSSIPKSSGISSALEEAEVNKVDPD